MTHWRNTMVDRPVTNGPAYVTGWTISLLAVLGAIVAVWVLGHLATTEASRAGAGPIPPSALGRAQGR
jgi:hypothetical protein